MSKSQIERYAFQVPLLFEGDRGSGKTYDVREFARSGKIPYLEIAGNESLESFDFLGHVMQSEHGMVWKDGKLSQAFRVASEGKKVALLIDEMLRIPQRHLSVLLSALSPDADGNYRLQTGRMVAVKNGIGSEEELVIPSTSIAIFATTNVGPEFAIDDLDPAVAERFIILRKDTELAQLTKILQSKAELREFSKLTALKLTEFFSKTQRMVKTGQLNRHATTRTLARAIDLALDEQDIAQVLKDQILLWVDRDSSGQPVKEQKDALVKTIDELFNPPVEKARKAAPMPTATAVAPSPPPPSIKFPPSRPTPSVPPSVTPSRRPRKDSSDFFNPFENPHESGFAAASAKWKAIEEKAAAAKLASVTAKPEPIPVAMPPGKTVSLASPPISRSVGGFSAASAKWAHIEASVKAKKEDQERRSAEEDRAFEASAAAADGSLGISETKTRKRQILSSKYDTPSHLEHAERAIGSPEPWSEIVPMLKRLRFLGQYDQALDLIAKTHDSLSEDPFSSSKAPPMPPNIIRLIRELHEEALHQAQSDGEMMVNKAPKSSRFF